MESSKGIREIRDWKKITLIFSILLNFIFLTLLFLLFFHDPIPLSLDFSSLKTSRQCTPSNRDEIFRLVKIPNQQLQVFLNDKTQLEDGLKRRDLALALLVKRDHLDIERALETKPSWRKMPLNEKISLTCYPGLTDADFQKIHTFLTREEWPETTYGLFELLKKQGTKEPSLVQAFLRSPEFLLAHRLFSPPLPQKLLLKLLLEAPYKLLSNYCESQREGLDLSEVRRREFLKSYVMAGSTTAAQLLLKTDFAYVLKEISDEEVLKMLTLLPKGAKLVEAYAKGLLDSPRSDRVHQSAIAIIHPIDELEIAQRPGPRPTIGELRPSFREKPNAAPSSDLHIIQRGETLTSLSERYHVPAGKIIQVNHLQSRTLQPGKTLKIP